MNNDETVTLTKAQLRELNNALMSANRVLNLENTRFNRLDQNPYGVRDEVGNAFRLANKLLTI